jgi:hypothetical protein
MSTVSETIPAALQPDVDAALEWFNRDQAVSFEVTWILDPDEALASDLPRDLKLVPCGGDRCEQRSFWVADGAIGFLEDAAEVTAAAETQAELDPPPGPRRGWLDLYVQPRLDFLKQSSPGFEPTHPKGYLQPGVLVLSREGRVLYLWRSVPSRKNVGGATVRPTAEHVVWSSVQAALAPESEGSDAVHDDHPEMDSPQAPSPIFVSLLIANGWFIRPLAFAQQKNGPTPQQRIRFPWFAWRSLRHCGSRRSRPFPSLPYSWVGSPGSSRRSAG